MAIVPRPPGSWRERCAAWRTELAPRAATEHAADWVLPGDPDEFWWPLVGDLKGALGWISEPYDIVMAPRTDFLSRRPPSGVCWRT